MILELYFRTASANLGIPTIHECTTIPYDSEEKLVEGLKKINNTDNKYSTLVIWGTHGSKKKLCGIDEKGLSQIVEKLQDKGCKFRTIVLDACESACHAKKFLPVLKDGGKILCHMGIAREQILREEREKIVESSIRNLWLGVLGSLLELSKDMLLGEYTLSILPISSFFPAVYIKNEMRMHHFVHNINGQTFFEHGEDDSFDESQLVENVKITNSNEEKELNKFETYVLE